jgi:hypothetical protein
MYGLKLSGRQTAASFLFVLLLFIPQFLVGLGLRSTVLAYITSTRGFFGYFIFLIILVLILDKILPKKYTSFLSIKGKSGSGNSQ